MKNHIKAIFTQYIFFSIWAFVGLLVLLMMPDKKCNSISIIGAFLIIMILMLVFIAINYFIAIKSLQFVESSQNSTFNKYVFSFLAYTGFYSVIIVFIPYGYSDFSNTMLTQQALICSLITSIIFYASSIIPYKIFNKRRIE